MASPLDRIFEHVVNTLPVNNAYPLHKEKKTVMNSLKEGLKMEGFSMEYRQFSKKKGAVNVPCKIYQSPAKHNDLGSPSAPEHTERRLAETDKLLGYEEHITTVTTGTNHLKAHSSQAAPKFTVSPFILPEPRCDTKTNLFFDAECLVIGSYGDTMTSLNQVVPKLESSYGGKEEEVLAIAERVCSDRYKEMASLAPFPVRGLGKPVGVWVDDEKVSHSKEFYLTLMEDFLKQCKTPAAVIWYSGHGEDATGNWCFRDGTIRFREIFELYQAHFKHKLLYIISDCSYSGCWVQDMACILDDMGIPPCGHHTREQGILLKLWTSCHCSEQETFMRFVEEGVKIVNDGCLTRESYTLDDFQNCLTLHTIHPTCPSRDANVCTLGAGMKLLRVPLKWKHKSKSLGSYVYLVRGKDRGREAWHYVLIEPKKVNMFKDKVTSGTIDVADYGQVLDSGWGKDPPEKVKSAIDAFFG